jgi:hypothetical protein
VVPSKSGLLNELAGQIEVLHVLNGARDYEAILFPES